MGSIRDLLPFVVMAIPIIAIVGGIAAGIIRTLGEQRLIELAHRERIAAIERGVDPSKLPPLPTSLYEGRGGRSPSLRRAQGLLVGGLVTVAVGIGMFIFFQAIEPHENYWALATVPILAGAALLVSAVIIWPRGNGNGSASGTTPPQVP